MAVEYRSLRTAELDAWYALCGQLFSVGPAYFRRHFEMDPWADVDGIFVGVDEGKLVSSVRVFRRYLMLEGRPVPTGGIGEVCTLPDYRGQGISGRLLTMAMAYMRAHGMQLGALYGVLTSHYGKHGFKPVETRFFRVRTADLPKAPEGASVRAFARGDLPAVQGLYDLYAGQYPLSFWRGEDDYWTKWVLSEWKDALVIEQGGRIAAYADVEAGADGLFLRDAACVPGEEAALYALIGKVARLRGCETVTGPEPVLAGASCERVGEEEGHLMLSVVTPFDGIADLQALLARMQGEIVHWPTDGF